MAKRQKERQHNGQKTEGKTTQWPKDRRKDNTMAKRQKERQHNGQKQNDKQRSKNFSGGWGGVLIPHLRYILIDIDLCITD